MTGDQLFIRLARTASRFTGRSLSFVLALVVVVAWLASGPLFDFVNVSAFESVVPGLRTVIESVPVVVSMFAGIWA